MSVDPSQTGHVVSRIKVSLVGIIGRQLNFKGHLGQITAKFKSHLLDPPRENIKLTNISQSLPF